MSTRTDSTIDYYFSVLSDWAYMGGERFELLARRYGVAINHKPMRLGQLYEKTGGILLQKRSKQRQDYRLVELTRWSKYLGIPVTLFPKYYPTSDLISSCTIIAAKKLGLDCGLLANAILRAIWAQDRDISDAKVISQIATGLGMGSEAVVALARSPETIAEFDSNTSQAAEAGVYGSPFYIFEGEAYWGQDRLQFLEDQLAEATKSSHMRKFIPETQGALK